MPTTHLGWYTDNPYNNMSTLPTSPGSCRSCAGGCFPASAPAGDICRGPLHGRLWRDGGPSGTDTFSRAVSLSGGGHHQPPGKQGREGAFWTDLFGPADRRQAALTTCLRLRGAGGQRAGAAGPVYLWCGTEDFIPGQPAHAGSSGGAGYPLRQRGARRPQLYWDREIQPALDWLLDRRRFSYGMDSSRFLFENAGHERSMQRHPARPGKRKQGGKASCAVAARRAW